MFGWEFPPHNSGGLGVACAGLTRALCRQGIRITFVLPRRMDVSHAEMDFIFGDAEGMNIYSVDSCLHPYVTPETYRRSAPGNSFLYGHTLQDEVYRYGRVGAHIAKRRRFDIIHAHDWLSLYAGMEAKRVSGKPLVIHMHATEFDRTGGHNINSFVYETERMGMEYADKIIAVSNLTKNIIVSRYKIPDEKVEVIHNQIDISEYGHGGASVEVLSQMKRRGTKVVLFVGRITLQKGPDYFLRAAASVLKFMENTVFVIAGSGDMEPLLLGEVSRLGISKHVIFAGFLRGDELSSLYKAADAYVMPSVSEPFGLTSLEALVHGTPVIMSKQSGVSEVVRHALKVDFWDVDELTNTIVAVLQNAPLRNTLQRYGQEEVKHMSWDHAARSCVAVYRRVLACL